MKTYYLYYLIDPNTNLVRYVGITCRPIQRYREHLRNVKTKNSHKDNWIRKLLINNQKPIFKIVLNTQDKTEILEHEIKTIATYDNLTNSTTGGEYFTFTSDVINKMKERNKGCNNPCYKRVWTIEERQNLSIIRKGRVLDETWKKRIGLGMKNRKPIIINGVSYTSIKEAMRLLKIGFIKACNSVTN